MPSGQAGVSSAPIDLWTAVVINIQKWHSSELAVLAPPNLLPLMTGRHQRRAHPRTDRAEAVLRVDVSFTRIEGATSGRGELIGRHSRGQGCQGNRMKGVIVRRLVFVDGLR